MTTLDAIYFLFMASLWLFALAAANAVVIAAMWVYDYLRGVYLARRNEQQLQLEIRHRRGWKTLKRIGWLPEDLK